MSLFKKKQPIKKDTTPVYVSKLGKGTSTQYKKRVEQAKGVRKSSEQHKISIVSKILNVLRFKKKDKDDPESIEL